jgi:hypothetical protein
MKVSVDDIRVICVPGRDEQYGSDSAWFAWAHDYDRQVEIGRGAGEPKLTLDGWRAIAERLSDLRQWYVTFVTKDEPMTEWTTGAVYAENRHAAASFVERGSPHRVVRRVVGACIHGTPNNVPVCEQCKGR